MKLKIHSIRPFIGSKDFAVSRSFYQHLGFTESIITEKLSLFKSAEISFYLQDYYVRDWLENTMLSILVSDINQCYQELQQHELENKYQGVKVLAVEQNHWGAECIVIDPAGALLRFTQFYA
ncbi:MAG: glyoxalase [Sphingobacteriaceae bacterium]|nr:MAG: glyoxalase [Sphingobacteriaceae bacterium]